MPISAEYRELSNGKRFYTSKECTMSDHRSTEENITGNSSENIDGEVSEIQTLTQEAVNEHDRGFIATGNDLVGARNYSHTATLSLPQKLVWYHIWYSHTSVRHGDRSPPNPTKTAIDATDDNTSYRDSDRQRHPNWSTRMSMY